MWLHLIMFVSVCPQAKQQRLTEDHNDVNDTLGIARGSISETESTVAEVDAMVQVRPA